MPRGYRIHGALGLRLPNGFLNAGRRRYDMMVIRLVTDPDDPEEHILAESRPCNNCIMVMLSFGINRVYYSTGDGTLRCERVADMEFMHESRGFRQKELFPKS